MDLDFHARFKQSLNKLKTTGEAYALARKKSYYMQEMKKVVRSRIQNSFGDVPMSRSEMMSYASADYEKHLQETAEAIYQEEKVSNDKESAKSEFEANRSLCSLDKATRNLETH